MPFHGARPAPFRAGATNDAPFRTWQSYQGNSVPRIVGRRLTTAAAMHPWSGSIGPNGDRGRETPPRLAHVAEHQGEADHPARDGDHEHRLESARIGNEPRGERRAECERRDERAAETDVGRSLFRRGSEF